MTQLRFSRIAHDIFADPEVAVMYAGQLSMATTNGEIRCQMLAQIICLLAVAQLFC